MTNFRLQLGRQQHHAHFVLHWEWFPFQLPGTLGAGGQGKQQKLFPRLWKLALTLTLGRDWSPAKVSMV